MKTSMNQVFASRQNVGLRLLDWSGDAVAPGLGQSLTPSRDSRRTEFPELRIVEKQDLFKYATATKVVSEFWETVVFTALAVSAAGGVVMAFLAR
jgi:hypothetical protein